MLGYLDDLLIVPLGILIAVRLIPADLLDEFRHEAASRARPVSAFGAINDAENAARIHIVIADHINLDKVDSFVSQIAAHGTVARFSAREFSVDVRRPNHVPGLKDQLQAWDRRGVGHLARGKFGLKHAVRSRYLPNSGHVAYVRGDSVS